MWPKIEIILVMCLLLRTTVWFMRPSLFWSHYQRSPPRIVPSRIGLADKNFGKTQTLDRQHISHLSTMECARNNLLIHLRLRNAWRICQTTMNVVFSDCQVKYLYLTQKLFLVLFFRPPRNKFNFFQCDALHGAKEIWTLEYFWWCLLTLYVMIVVDKILEHCRLGSR